jgi:PAS domain S-box-containing protein
MTENDSRANVLMVDDQPAKLLSYEAILDELDLNLIKVTSGREALERLLRTDIAVVLMDVSMPELDGFQLAEMIRGHPRCQQTAIIFVSAVHMSDLDRLKGYERGAVDYISVPVVPELLRAKVSVFAELHRRARQLETLNRELEQRVTERTDELNQRAEALQQLNGELARKNQELDAIVKTAPDIIFSRQADGARDYISGRFYEFTGALPGSANGFGWLEYVHPEDKERSIAQWMHCVESNENYESEYRLRSKEGQYRWFRARAVPLRDHQGRAVRWYGTCSDIHDSKIIEYSMRDSAAELEKVVAERTEALRFLSSRLMSMQDDERRRIARELHDGLGQDLVAVKMLANAILQEFPMMTDHIMELSDMIDTATQQLRGLSHLLHPPLLDEVGLMSAVRWYLDGLTKRSGIETVLEVRPEEFPRLAPELERAMFRIIQEALTNVFRHSGAGKTWVTVLCEDNKVTVRVRDDGKGIEKQVSELQPGSVGVGIAGISQRAKEFGGDLRVTNAYPGTIVEAVIPFQNAGPHPPETRAARGHFSGVNA